MLSRAEATSSLSPNAEAVESVFFVDGATRIDVRAAHEIAQHIATEHKNFITIVAVAQREDRGRRA